MDRTGEVAELLVEHSTDLRMCDLLEEGMPGSGSGTGGGGSAAGAGGPRKSGDGALGLGLVAGRKIFYSFSCFFFAQNFTLITFFRIIH